MPDIDSVTIPYLATGESGIMLTDRDSQLRLLAKVFENEGHSLDEVPALWAETPLRAWCWLILTVNGLELDPEVHRPIVHWGIDLGFSSTEVRRFIWAIS